MRQDIIFLLVCCEPELRAQTDGYWAQQADTSFGRSNSDSHTVEAMLKAWERAMTKHMCFTLDVCAEKMAVISYTYVSKRSVEYLVAIDGLGDPRPEASPPSCLASSNDISGHQMC